ncbi:MAG: xanthine dehydrogenase family protein subunit M [Gemmatimonadetes bacterium]|nr:xanthine dehydrogenase family protein subunit M [Gemmatimonadota bacterium]MBT5327150.1 xanthine dehydrogenase family protein subunit M [Gemmatimonadota bacterium]MBT5451928.1 xanthine dehydrogenase family protein subunit M [Gemmatimonadota bacterium]MBT5800318.1 xanthine dehydrogenase family protein subunit M [Gemmatimonadota bacterium]MBT6619827.1 xanthine dehydrogenase family protein subunit M [Gemmatimonadota bacterium]
MKDFEYCAPKTLREAVALKAEKGEAARVLAGGTDLIVQLRGKRFAPDRVIDIKNIADVNELSYSPRKGLIIGAGVPCWRVYNDAEIAELYPGLIDSAAIIGGIQIQGRATFGGNLCNSSPSADTIPSLMTHSAVCNLIGPNGKRKVPVVDFCTGPGRNVLEPGEILVSLQIPGIKKNTGAHYQRFIPRNEMDIAVVGVSSQVVLANRGKEFKEARIALAAVGPTPIFAAAAGEALAGQAVSDEAIAAAAAAAQSLATPISDMRGPAEFRTHLVGVLVKRTLEGAIARARGKFVANAVQEAAG